MTDTVNSRKRGVLVTNSRGKVQVKRRVAKKCPVNGLRRRIRDLTRLLQHASNRIPDDELAERTRELQACREELKYHEAWNRRTACIRKYHMVRFFDRQKASRALKRANKSLSQATQNSIDLQQSSLEQLKQAVREAEIDLNYTRYYPLSMPYCSLYPSNKSSDSTASFSRSQSGNPHVRQLIIQAMTTNSLDKLRDILFPDSLPSFLGNAKHLSTSSLPVNSDSVKPDKPSFPKSHSTSQSPPDSDSDGGFFE